MKRPFQKWHLDGAAADISRDFRGLGPSISWDASAPLVGNPRNAEFTFDWGANAALLFGRQKVRAHHQTMQQYNSSYHFNGTLPIVYHHSYNPGRSKTVIVPNIGGFAGVSLKFPNAKISIGYQAISSSARWTAASTSRKRKIPDSTGLSPQSVSVSADKQRARIKKAWRISPPPFAFLTELRGWAYQFFVIRRPNRRGSVTKTLVVNIVSSELRKAPVMAVVLYTFFT